MAWYEERSAAELLEDLSIRIYESPLLERRLQGDWPSSSALTNVRLFLDFDTEVSMQGIAGFLENRGSDLPATIEMFRAVGARQTADLLLKVQGIMEAHGITAARLRADFDGHDEFEITTFRKLHGPAAGSMAEEIGEAAQELYLYRQDAEDAYALIEAYIAEHRVEVIGALREAGA